MRRLLIAAVLLVAPCAALAQSPAPVEAAAPAATVLRNTPVVVALAEPVGSNTSKPGDRFAITLAEPLMVDGQVVLPAGTPGVGEVVHVAPSGLGGRSGEILLAARYLEVGDAKVPLKAFQFAASGRDTSAGSLWSLGLVKGGQVIVPAGARGTAKIAADFTPAPSPPAHP